MASNDKNEPQTNGQSAPPPAGEDLFSLEKLDELIDSQDPDFKKDLGDMGAEGASDLNIELIDLDRLLAEEETRSFKSRLRRLIVKLRSFQTGVRTRFGHFLKEELPHLVKKTVAALKSALETAREGLRQFGFKPLKYKLALFGVLLLAVVFGAYVFLASTRELISAKSDLFVHSLEEIADRVDIYDPAKESEALYDSTRAAQNIIIIPKMVANLKRSSKSGPNPMIACELYVEGNSPDVVVEIKDREYEIRDLFQRTMEEMTVEQLESPEGKRMLLERLSRAANGIVTKGRVRHIYFKTIILKP